MPAGEREAALLPRQPCPGLRQAGRQADALGRTRPSSLLGLKQEAAQRISKSLSSRFVKLHAQFLRFSTMCSVSLSPVALKVGLSWAEAVLEEQGGPVTMHIFLAQNSHSLLTFSACPSQRGQRRFIVNGRALSLGAWVEAV